MRKSITVAALALALAAVSVTAAVAGPPGRTVVELFTSQGCASCRPADALLGELAMRDDLIALSFHVDYWDYIGWKDPFATPEGTARQRDYRAALGKGYVYTPQMVIGGTEQTVGSGRLKVMGLIRKMGRAPKLDIEISHGAGRTASVRIPAGPRRKRAAAVWLVFYDREHTTQIRRGENRGVTLTNTNVVRKLMRVASWRGDELVLKLDLDGLGAVGRDGCALIVQAAGLGPILGAVAFPLPGGGS